MIEIPTENRWLINKLISQTKNNLDLIKNINQRGDDLSVLEINQVVAAAKAGEVQMWTLHRILESYRP